MDVELKKQEQVIYGLYDLYYEYLAVVFNEKAYLRSEGNSDIIWAKICEIIDKYQLDSDQMIKLYDSTPQIINMLTEKAEAEYEPELSAEQIEEIIFEQQVKVEEFLLNN